MVAIKPRAGCTLLAMTIPPEWLHLYVGDRIHSVAPFHQLTRAIRSIAKDGYQFDLERSERGHWLICTASPRRSPHRNADDN